MNYATYNCNCIFTEIVPIFRHVTFLPFYPVQEVSEAIEYIYTHVYACIFI